MITVDDQAKEKLPAKIVLLKALAAIESELSKLSVSGGSMSVDQLKAIKASQERLKKQDEEIEELKTLNSNLINEISKQFEKIRELEKRSFKIKITEPEKLNEFPVPKNGVVPIPNQPPNPDLIKPKPPLNPDKLQLNNRANSRLSHPNRRTSPL